MYNLKIDKSDSKHFFDIHIYINNFEIFRKTVFKNSFSGARGRKTSSLGSKYVFRKKMRVDFFLDSTVWAILFHN